MWRDLVLALALLLVLEGLLPFINPAGFRQAMQMIGKMNDKQLRTGGFVSMLAGVLLMYLINNLSVQ
ncbi:MAG: DUF2065 domain-containing protein [Gammaproteobacteria bacterium]|nr:DUF2065 domain-containing protein [Gammaproteobacteria bacterium]